MKNKSKHSKHRLPGPPPPKAKTVNPFSLHQNRKKFEVLGQSMAGTKGRPGVSRQRATDNRYKTLYQEYMSRHKSNVFMDRRLGERDRGADQEKKMDLRRVGEMKKTMNKHSLYNLTEDDVLTHGGVALNDDNVNLAISDDEGLEEDGMLDAAFVKDQHFGGADPQPGEDEPHEEESPRKRFKSQKDREEEIIAASKMRKKESMDKKEEQSRRVDRLNDVFSTFMEINAKNVVDSAERKRKYREEKSEFDRLMRRINSEKGDHGGGAKATDRLKPPEELAKDEQDRLRALEEDRVRRMQGEGVLDAKPKDVAMRSADSLDDGMLALFDSKAPLRYSDGRLLVDSDGDEAPNKPRLSKDEKKRRKKEARLEEKMRAEEMRLLEDVVEEEDEEGAEVEDAVEECDEDNVEEEEEESDEEDNYSDILDEEEDEGRQDKSECEDHTEEPDNNSDDETLFKENQEQNNSNIKLVSKVKKSKDDTSKPKTTKTNKKRVSFTVPEEEDEEARQTLIEDAKMELPFTFEVPSDFDSFWTLLHGRHPTEVSTLLTRMIASNHPNIRHSNKLHCAAMVAYILRTLERLCRPSTAHTSAPSLTSHINALVPHLYSLMKLCPEETAREVLLIFIRKRDEYRNCSKKRYPGLDTLIILQVAGLLFPATDFFHHVMTPVKWFLVTLLGEAKMRGPRCVLAAIFVATLLHEYTRETRRYCPELVTRLMGLVLRCVPVAVANTAALDQELRGVQWLLSPTLPHHDMLVLESQSSAPPPKLPLSLLTTAPPALDDPTRCSVLLAALRLLRDLCQDWAALPSVREVMAPLPPLLDMLPTPRYPALVREAVGQLRAAVEALPPHPPRLRVDKGRPKPLRMLEPVFRDIKANAPRSAFNKSELEASRQKLLCSLKRERKAAKREILKDTQFLAKQKLKETLASDAERKRKVNLIMQDLGLQESEHQKYEKMKPGQR